MSPRHWLRYRFAGSGRGLIRRTYVNVEPFHLFRYVDEEASRFNSRKATEGERFQRLAGKVASKRVTYQQLTAAPTTPA